MNCSKCNTEVPDKFKFCPECGSSISGQSEAEISLGDMASVAGNPVSAAQDAVAGGESLADRYELGDEIGRGGFAVVYKAVDKKLGRTVAIKKLHAEHDGQALDRFKREARVIAGLNHRNVVAVHDVGEESGDIFLVMEYIPGGSLREYLKKNGKLELAEALQLMNGIVQGLSYAHRRNLVHRDIKPANILLQEDSGKLVPKIVDFGLAQAGRDSELSMTGYGMGSPYYMPPEQRRDAKSVNHTADIYALGKVLYEMVTGEIPDNVDPSVIPPPAALSDIIFKCIKSKPEERYFSADELLQDLEGLGGRAHQIGSHKSAIGNAFACPACGSENAEGVKFCAKCGGGLTHTCGECGREDSKHNRFCGGCGTDIPGFAEASETVARMEAFMREMKWSRVQKEFSLFDQSIKLPGEKGRKLKKMVAAIRDAAAKLEEHYAASPETVEKGDYQDAINALDICLKLDPENTTLKKLMEELYEKTEIPAGHGRIVDLGDGVKIELVWIPPTTSMQWKKLSGGKETFLMGSPASEKECSGDEQQHEVKLTKGFWLGKYPVTQTQYEKVMGTNPSLFKRKEKTGFLQWTKHTQPNHPVEQVSWLDAAAFCKKLSELIDGEWGLPTEAQWEYACRAGSPGRYCFGDEVSRLKEYAWYAPNAGNTTHPVGQKKANAWGLYDMHGNVREWCSDWYKTSNDGSATDPQGASYGSSRVHRGGSWYDVAWSCRSAYRYWSTPDYRFNSVGLRLRLTAPLSE